MTNQTIKIKVLIFEPEIQEARRITSLSTRSTSHEILMEAVVATTEPLPLHILPLPPDADVPRSAADRGRAVLASAVSARLEERRSEIREMRGLASEWTCM